MLDCHLASLPSTRRSKTKERGFEIDRESQKSGTYIELATFVCKRYGVGLRSLFEIVPSQTPHCASRNYGSLCDPDKLCLTLRFRRSTSQRNGCMAVWLHSFIHSFPGWKYDSSCSARYIRAACMAVQLQKCIYPVHELECDVYMMCMRLKTTLIDIGRHLALQREDSTFKQPHLADPKDLCINMHDNGKLSGTRPCCIIFN